MKQKKLIAVLAVVAMLLAFGACGASQDEEQPTEQSQAVASEESTTEASADDDVYVGSYKAEDGSTLDITKTGDEKYGVEIGIVGLTTLSNGTGELIEDGMVFTATNSADDKDIGGSITIDGDKMIVLITDSTWDLMPNGETFEFERP